MRQVVQSLEKDTEDTVNKDALGNGPHHWGMRYNLATSTCPCCTLSLQTPVLLGNNGIALFPCGHAYHVNCMIQKKISRCNLHTWKALAPLAECSIISSLETSTQRAIISYSTDFIQSYFKFGHASRRATRLLNVTTKVLSVFIRIQGIRADISHKYLQIHLSISILLQ